MRTQICIHTIVFEHGPIYYTLAYSSYPQAFTKPTPESMQHRRHTPPQRARSNQAPFPCSSFLAARAAPATPSEYQADNDMSSYQWCIQLPCSFGIHPASLRIRHRILHSLGATWICTNRHARVLSNSGYAVQFCLINSVPAF